MPAEHDTTDYRVRHATAADARVLARHRAEMFRDMGRLPESCYGAMELASHAYFTGAIASGEYVAWVATPADARDHIVAGAGLHFRPVLPGLRQGLDGVEVTTGLLGYVMNVFVERDHRRRGLARLLMQHVLAEAARLELAQVALHASDDGRRLYESLGFHSTNEMRYAGSLARPTPSP